ncbi:hypothetical protein [Nocardioides sp.]|uniref:hypothetical protein n=1 Tax=Nocardioides sp. TaxID=35761 RepID=UPI003D1220BB
MSHWGYVVEQFIRIDEESIERERRRQRRRSPRRAGRGTAYEITCARAAGMSRSLA